MLPLQEETDDPTVIKKAYKRLAMQWCRPVSPSECLQQTWAMGSGSCSAICNAGQQ